MKMRTRFRFSSENGHFWYIWLSNLFIAVMEELYIKIHLHTTKISFAEYNETPGIAKKWLFWPNFLFYRLTSFLNRFQKFQRIWDLWRKDFFHTKLEKRFWDMTHPSVQKKRVKHHFWKAVMNGSFMHDHHQQNFCGRGFFAFLKNWPHTKNR